jgi:hypothetical protein
MTLENKRRISGRLLYNCFKERLKLLRELDLTVLDRTNKYTTGFELSYLVAQRISKARSLYTVAE